MRLRKCSSLANCSVIPKCNPSSMFVAPPPLPFRQKGSDPETGIGPVRRGPLAQDLSARHHLQQRGQESERPAQVAPRAPGAPAGPQALQEARAAPEVAERRPLTV